MPKLKKFFYAGCRSLFLCGLCLWSLSFTKASGQSSFVYFAQLEDQTINPATADYLIKAIDQAEEDGAEALVIKLDTPGGLLTSTRRIVKRMLKAKVPLVVYVAPEGAHAGSAGTFITYAAHIAAMAPSTNIGAAHPVSFGGGAPGKQSSDWKELKEQVEQLRAAQKTVSPEEEAKEKTATSPADTEIASDANPMGSKILHDTVAFIKAIAAERHRNAEWAVESVVHSASLPSREALKKNVVDLIASSDKDLLTQLDGRKVLIEGKPVLLQTKDAAIKRIVMTPRERFFDTLADPNIAYFLMILGFYGLLFEFTHPGFGLPGILGGIFLILAFYSMQTLPTNYAGVALIVLGIILLVAEVYTPTFGVLSLGGLGSLVLGSLLLFDSTDPLMRVSKQMILTAALTTGGITFFVLAYVVRNQRKKALGGREGLIGETGTVQRVLDVGTEAKIFVHGEIWTAQSSEPLKAGEEVVVKDMQGMVLLVEKKPH